MKNQTFKKISLLGLISLFVFLCVIPVNINAQLKENVISLNKVGISTVGQQQEQKVQYIPGEVIVKLKEESEPNVLFNQRYSIRQAKHRDIFSRLKTKYRLRKEQPIFKALHNQLKARNLTQNEIKEKIKSKLYRRETITGGQEARQIDLLPIYILKTDQDVLTICKQLNKDPNIDYAQPNYIVSTSYIPNDPYYHSSASWGQNYDDLWGLKPDKLDCERAWDVSNGEGIVVAVVDTGVDYTHPDIRQNIWVNPKEDINHNGIVEGENFSDTGPDRLFSYQEPGYDMDKNPDPNGDDYGPITNPNGKEGNFRYDIGEPFEDCGLDGICPESQFYTNPDPDGSEGNGIYDPGDKDGLDNDGNGKIDDISGWNFNTYVYDRVGTLIGRKPEGHNSKDDNFHGTHVAGTISAVANNIGIIGVAYKSKIMPIKGLGDSGMGSDDDLARALYYAADNGARVINNSWGGFGKSPLDKDAIDYAYSLGCVLVAAAGNSTHNTRGITEDIPEFFPANYENVITVSAFEHDDKVADFSNWGSKIDVAAPGGDRWFDSPTDEFCNILSLKADCIKQTSLNVGDYYIRLRGTSMAAPHVSGLAALILSHHPEFSSEEVKKVIRVGSDDVAFLGGDVLSGHGRINCYRSLLIDNPDILPHAKINYPHDFEIVKGTSIEISGTVKGDLFQEAKIEYREGIWPTADEKWQTIAVLNYPVINGPLATWIISGLNDGYYTLRITARNSFSQWDTDMITVHIGNKIKEGWPVNIPGSALSSPLVADLDRDGRKEIVIVALDILSGQHKIFVYDENGVLLEGWPQILNNNGELSVGDIDGDGDLEIVIDEARVKDIAINGRSIRIYEGIIYVWHHNGVPADNWPKSIIPSNPSEQNNRSVLSSPIVLADLDKNGALEIIAASYDRNIYVFYGNGNIVAGWPQAMQYSCAHGVAPAVGDINNDGILEIVAVDYTGIVYAWDANGALLNGWPKFADSQIPGPGDPYISLHASPVLGDLDGDGTLEVIAIREAQYSPEGRRVMLYVWNGQSGNLLWSHLLPDYHWWGRESPPVEPALGDIDSDGTLEIVIITMGASIYEEQSQVYIFKADGSLTEHWVIPRGSHAGPLLVDLDQDGKSEIIATEIGGGGAVSEEAKPIYARTLCVWDSKGNMKNGWPVNLGNLLQKFPIISDLDNDNKFEIVAGTSNGVSTTPVIQFELINDIDFYQVYALDTEGKCSKYSSQWPMSRHDPQRTGCYWPRDYKPVLDIPVDSVDGFRITTDSAEQQSPAIYGKNIVWFDSRNSSYDLYRYDLASNKESLLVHSAQGTNLWWDGGIYGNKIVWAERESPEKKPEVFVLDITTGEKTRITNDSFGQYFTGIYKDKVVWCDNRNSKVNYYFDIYMYDLTTGQERRITTNPAFRLLPKIYGNIIVWQEGINNRDIYMYDMVSQQETRLTTDSSNQVGPLIYGNKIVWTDYRNGNADIYMYNLEAHEESVVINEPHNQIVTGIYDNEIVYTDDSNGNEEVYVFDLVKKEAKQVTFNEFNQITPVIYGDTIVWVDERDGNKDIYATRWPRLIGGKTTWEGERLEFQVFASDRGNDPLTLSAHLTDGRPLGAIGASFIDHGNATATFSWAPGFDQAGSYLVVFEVSDGFWVDSKEVTILVNEAGNIPFPPSNLLATSISTNTIRLSWRDNSDNEDGFKIERSLDGSSFIQIATVAANTVSFDDTGLNPGRKYYYRVCAYNGIGNSKYSNIAFAKTNSPPAVVYIYPNSGTFQVNKPYLFRTVFSDPDGCNDLSRVMLMFQGNRLPSQRLIAYYLKATNKLYLYNGSIYIGGFTPGSNNVIDTPYGKLYCSQTKVSGLGNYLIVSWSLSFKSPLIGPNYVYLLAVDNKGANTGWIFKGYINIVIR